MTLGFPYQPGAAPDGEREAETLEPVEVEQPPKVPAPRPRTKAKPAKAK